MEIKKQYVYETILFFKKKLEGSSKMFMYKVQHSFRFHSIGIDSLLEDVPVFMANSICSIFGTLHVFA